MVPDIPELPGGWRAEVLYLSLDIWVLPLERNDPELHRPGQIQYSHSSVTHLKNHLAFAVSITHYKAMI